jgi:hypothetical protein
VPTATQEIHSRLCVLAFDTAHPKNGTGILASYFFDVYICHVAKLGAFDFVFSKKKNRDI